MMIRRNRVVLFIIGCAVGGIILGFAIGHALKERPTITIVFPPTAVAPQPSMPAYIPSYSHET